MSRNSLEYARKNGQTLSDGGGCVKIGHTWTRGVYDMIRQYVHITSQTPHLDLYRSLWENTYDSSWIARDLTQTMLSLYGTSTFHQIGQLGINVTLLVFSLINVMVMGQYRSDEDDTYPEFGQKE